MKTEIQKNEEDIKQHNQPTEMATYKQKGIRDHLTSVTLIFKMQ